MLVIRHDQMEMFERIQFEQMQKRVECAIAAAFPDTCAAPPVDGAPAGKREANEHARGLVEKGIEHALNLGILEGADLAAFIALGLALRAVAMPPPAWMSGWLARPDTPAATRLAIVEAQLADLAATDAALLAIAERVRTARREAAL